jgi:hypothetical protein
LQFGPSDVAAKLQFTVDSKFEHRVRRAPSAAGSNY